MSASRVEPRRCAFESQRRCVNSGRPRSSTHARLHAARFSRRARVEDADQIEPRGVAERVALQILAQAVAERVSPTIISSCRITIGAF